MKRIRTVAALTTAVLLVAAGAYLTADAKDLVPGVLTLPEPIPANLHPLPTPAPASPTAEAAAPTADGLAAALAPVLADPALGGAAGAIVTDAETGTVIYAEDAERPRVIASAQKILSAVAVADQLAVTETMDTRVVGGSAGEVFLVAKGDTLLATGKGDPTDVVGRAGLGDLAAQVAKAAPAGPLVVHLDTSYAAGPRVPSVWNPADVTTGFTRGVSMIGLAENRPLHGVVKHQESDADVAGAFVAALVAAGRPASVAPALEATAPPDAPVLGQVSSAPIGEVLAHALAESDNAIVENLVRQAIVATGKEVPADGATGPFVVESLAGRGIPTTGLQLTDASGLGPGQKATLTAVDAVLTLGLGGKERDLRSIFAELPIGGLTGTLSDRFAAPDTADVAGIPQGKTGTLTGVAALAGLTTDADGRLLTFAVASDAVPKNYEGTARARAALDRFAAALTRCGCH
ncbi:MAG: D-alanyl-D-alanine carboxypeptidase [Actinobacteria bacterium]|nr:D-alanyl-D-alanine carboxypeptidase [Actinomycetota bacterium]